MISNSPLPNYETHSHCRGCRVNHEKHLILCPDCGEFLAHNPKNKSEKEFHRY